MNVLIRYAHILNDSIVDGPGIRVTVFLQGCEWDCPGCHNPHLFPRDGGIPIGERELAKMILKKIKPIHKGITFSGGDPLLQHAALYEVISYIRSRKPELDIWIYSGFHFENVKELPVLSLANVLVDGPFQLENKGLDIPFRGSSNQRLIDLTQSLASGKVVEYLY